VEQWEKIWEKLEEEVLIEAQNNEPEIPDMEYEFIQKSNFELALPIIKAELRKEFLKEFDLICGWCDNGNQGRTAL